MVNYLQLIFAFVLVMMSTVIPIFIIYTANTPSIPAIACQPHQEAVHFRFNPGSHIDIVSNSPVFGNSRLPLINQQDIQTDINKIQLKGDVESFTVDRSVLTAYNITNKRSLWITLPSNLVPVRKSIMSGCGTWSQDPLSKDIGLIHVDQVLSYRSDQ